MTTSPLDPAVGPPPHPATRSGRAPRVRSLVREQLAVLGLTLGSFLLGPLGWAVGLVLLWTSDRWTRRLKVLGTLVWPLGYTSVLVLLAAPGEGCWSVDGGAEVCEGSSLPAYLAIPALVLLLGAPVVVGSVLLVVASGRRRVELVRARRASGA